MTAKDKVEMAAELRQRAATQLIEKEQFEAMGLDVLASACEQYANLQSLAADELEANSATVDGAPQ
jgi:hypothetical protein